MNKQNNKKIENINNLFTFNSYSEGKIGIGKLPKELNNVLNDISKDYINIIPDKNASTHHLWFNELPQSLKKNIQIIKNHDFLKKICDSPKNCIRMSALEMDELYYSNPKNNITKTNLYGASGNFNTHRDCFFNFPGIKFYRILIGLSDNNNNIITYFNNLKMGKKINFGDYVIFDFDNTTHQVIKENENNTPRILLKLHFIVCENCSYSKNYVKIIKKIYLYYEYITRYIMHTGTDPKTFYEFFWGIICQYSLTKKIFYKIICLIIIILLILNSTLKIKYNYENLSKILKYLFVSLIMFYLFIVFIYWSRYKLIGIK